MWKRTWVIEFERVIEREIKQANALAVGRKCRKHVSGRFICTPIAGRASRAKMMYCFCSINIFGYQLNLKTPD